MTTDIVEVPAAPVVVPFPALGSTNYNDEAYAAGVSLPGFSAGMRALAMATRTNSVAGHERALAAEQAKIVATEQADLAMGYRNTAGLHATTATDQASLATAKAGEAVASAVQASKLNLGHKSTPPTLDNQGAALLAGATYYDTTLEKLRVWTGSAWGDGISAVAGVSSVNGAAGDVVGVVMLTGPQVLSGKTIGGQDNTVTVDGVNAVGFREIPQVIKNTAYTAVLADSGKHLLHPSADTTARTFTIPSNAAVPFPVGTALTFVNQVSAGVLTISITADVMRLAGAGTTGSRALAANGVATAIKITATDWLINGSGLT